MTFENIVSECEELPDAPPHPSIIRTRFADCYSAPGCSFVLFWQLFGLTFTRCLFDKRMLGRGPLIPAQKPFSGGVRILGGGRTSGKNWGFPPQVDLSCQADLGKIGRFR